MTDSEVTWGSPPSAMAVRPSLADLSPDQRRKAEARLLIDKEEERVRESIYQSPGFSKPEVLRLLDYAHATNGQAHPAADPEAATAPAGQLGRGSACIREQA
jgi:hypothetical protein